MLKYGPIAQLGERTVRIRKVVGSIPIRSTIKSLFCQSDKGGFCCNVFALLILMNRVFSLVNFCQLLYYKYKIIMGSLRCRQGE